MTDYALVYETPASSLVPARGNRYSDEMWQLAYEIWAFQADRNCTRTWEMLAEEIRAEAENEGVIVDEDSLDIPTVRQIQYRAKRENWPARATVDMATIAPQTYKMANVRLFAQIPQAQTVYGDILAGVYDDHRSPGLVQTKLNAAKDVLTFAAVGTAAGLLPPR